MPNKKTRSRKTRRDRRKAKASGWAREGKSNPKKVGHGTGGSFRRYATLTVRSNSEESPEVDSIYSKLKIKLSELAKLNKK